MELEEIIEIIKAKTPDFIDKARKTHRKLEVHVDAVDVPKYLEKIEGYENAAQFKLRKKFSGDSKYLMQNLLRPIDKVFTAKGSNRIYGVEGESATKQINEVVSNIEDGFSIKDWIKNVQSKKYITDPSGVVLFEWSVTEGLAETIPTIYSINEISNFSASGRMIDWILFEGETRFDNNGIRKRGFYVRFIDDKFDYTFLKDGDTVTLLDDEVFENPWGYAPAFLNSDIYNHTGLYMDSPIDSILSLADKYLRGASTRNIYEQLHMYPIFWMYAQKCESCKGTGEINGATCGTCNGSKQSMKKDVSDALLLSTPKSSDSPTIAPAVAGYVQPDLETFREAREEINWITRIMNFSMWGSNTEVADNQTATAAFLDVQPVNDRLGMFADAFEQTEKIMTDIVGDFYLKDSYDPNSTSINYGRRFLMESPDKIWEKYLNAKEKGAPDSSLDSLLTEYYNSEFATDPQSLGISKKAMKAEPWVHKSIEEVISMSISNEDKLRKVYFNEFWLNTSREDILITPVDKIQEGLIDFVKLKQIDNEKSQNVQASDSEESN